MYENCEKVVNNKILKICIVSHTYPFYPGDWRANFMATLAETYYDIGNDVTVFTPYHFGEVRSSDMVKKVKIIEYRYLPFKSLHLIGYGKSMKEDLIISLSTILLTPFLLIAGIYKMTKLLRNEKYDFLHCHWAVPNTIIAVGARWISGTKTKILTSFPGSDVTVLRRTGITGKILAKIILKSDYMSCNSSDLKDELVKKGIPPERIDYVIYGVDDRQKFYNTEKRDIIRNKLGIEKETIVLLLVGRFIPKKGFSTACKAMKDIIAKNANVKLVFIGSGNMQDEYISIMKKNGTIEHAIFIGNVATDELAGYYSACDIFLMPSEKLPADGLNTVVPEAMACARPIVASNVGGNDLVVFDGINGFLHDERDYETMAKLINKLIDNAGLREKLGQKSLELVKGKFNWVAIAKYYIDRYKDLYGKGNQS